ncbi:MAG: phosphoenolpyruvate carboxylase [Pseudomonadota bacterium]
MKSGRRDVLRAASVRWQRTVKATRHNPLANPVLEAALALNDLYDAEGFDDGAIVEAVQRLSQRALMRRAASAKAYLGGCDRKAVTACLDAIADALLMAGKRPRPFKAFAAMVEREVLGLVITAHPTFSMREEVMDLLAGLIEAGSPAARDKIAVRLAKLDHRPSLAISLSDERRMAQRALGHAQAALDVICRHVLERAEAVHGPRVWRLAPRLATVASWVGYDLDGRSDIDWATSLRFRYLSAAEAARDYHAAWRAIAKGWDALPARAIEEALGALARHYAELASLLPASAEDAEKTKAFSRACVAANSRRQALIEEVKDKLDVLRTARGETPRTRAVGLFAARLARNGFGLNHIHFRLNAAQLHNAIRPAVMMETSPDAASNRRRYLGTLVKLLEKVEPVSVNFGSLVRERTTARRLFMLMAQILKFVDDSAPIRLLIAESDTPFTVLAALYYARLFGIADKVEICPLFETDAGLERGARVIGELLEDAHYRAYVKRHRRLAVQTGYSDAGRYLGQLAAGLAIERFRIKLAQLWTKHDLKDVELVIFDTHGESVGRGAHPDGLADRLDYVHPPRARQVFAAHQVPYKQEISLQGGDGYVWLWTPKLARATLARLLQRALAARDGEGATDPFYVDTDYSLDFFLTLKEFQARTVYDADYLPMLTGFGVNLLYPSGSRMTLRQRESGATAHASHIGQIRAIPHNAILQQLGYMANTLGGMGTAIAKDGDGYGAIRDQSARLKQLRAMVRHALRFSDLRILEAYLGLFDPETWLHYAAAEAAPKRRARMQRLAGHLERLSVDVDHGRVIRAFLADSNDLLAALAELGFAPGEGVDEDLILIHVLRLALMQQLFMLAARIPRFSSRPDLTLEEVIEQLLRLDVPGAIATLRDVFPIEPDMLGNGDYGEAASFAGDAARGYIYENRMLFDRIERLYDLIRRLGVALIHHIGAVG